MEEKCEINGENDNYWDAEEEINENEGVLPQNKEVKKANKDENNILSDIFSIDRDDAIKISGKLIC